MRRFIGLVLLATVACSMASAGPTRRLSVAEYRDHMMGAWIGQIAGVSRGAPTEFRWQDRIIPEAEMPAWKPSMINDAFGQDDLYVEMTFVRTLEKYGYGCSIRRAGIDFANSRYSLWCANNAGRTNLRKGIAPPDSSHPKFNKCPNDIDYQIEADFSGILAPGLPQLSVALGERFGRLMNYGDGMYAGQFIGAMYAEAYFERDIRKVVEAGLEAIPAGCQYAEMVRDMLAWSRANPEDWQATWQLCQAKYRLDPQYQKASNGGIDCKINGAYVLMGLLYGKGDPDRTMEIACRCGMDSDCNPSSAAGVLFATLGYSRLEPRFTQMLDRKTRFSYTAYNFPKLVDVSVMLARKAVLLSGGRVVGQGRGEVWEIPVQSVVPSPLELSWAPGPASGSRFSKQEMAAICVLANTDGIDKAVAEFAPGWTVAQCGPDMDPGLKAQALGREHVLLIHPLDQSTPCVLRKAVAVPAGGATLYLTVGHHPQGDWDLVVLADGKEILRRTVGTATAPEGWLDAEVDLRPYAGKKVKLEVVNQPTNWAFEAAYIARLEIR